MRDSVVRLTRVAASQHHRSCKRAHIPGRLDVLRSSGRRHEVSVAVATQRYWSARDVSSGKHVSRRMAGAQGGIGHDAPVLGYNERVAK